MKSKKISLTSRFYIFLIPAVMLSGLANVLYTWVVYQETTERVYLEAMEKNVRDITILAKETTFKFYFEDLEKGYITNQKNDLIDAQFLFANAMLEMAKYGGTPIHMVFYNRDWKILSVKGVDDVESIYSFRSSHKNEHIGEHAEPFYNDYKDFSKPYSELFDEHQKIVLPIFSEKKDQLDSGEPKVLGFIHAEILLPLSKFKEESYSKWLVNTQWVLGQILFLTLLLSWVGRSVTKPFILFCDHVEESSAAKFAKPFFSESNIAELGVLERTLNNMREDILNRQQQLLHALKDATAASEAKSRFLANMSHEIRTPMNAVMGLSELALHDNLKPKTRDYLKKINSASHSLLRIINDILDFSKIEAGKLELEQSDFQLRNVMDHLTDMFMVQSSKKNIELIMSASNEYRYELNGDSLRLEQVLLNLIGNALKFTLQGEIEVRVKTVKEYLDQVTLEFSVRDTGIGMSKEQLDNLFQAFLQGDTSTTRKFGGTGLGLTISKKLVELMGGKLWIESEKDRGSTLYFTAVFKRRHEVEEQIMVLPDDMRKYKILVIDDNQAVGNSLQQMLEMFGFKPHIVGSGMEAINKIQQSYMNKQPYQLVIVDYFMPEMNGVATVKKIKSVIPSKFMPLTLLMTPYGQEDEELFGSAGIDTHIAKPINCTQLFNSIMGLFGKDIVKTDKSNNTKINLKKVTKKIAGARVLLVEDNLINQQVATEILRGIGLVVETAQNGLQAVEKVDKASYDLVLMDIQMPEMDGHQATKHIRNNQRCKELPIIAMTAHAMAGDRDKCLQSGMNDHLSKPIDRKALYTALMKWIKQREGMGLDELPKNPIKEDYKTLSTKYQLPGIDAEDALHRLGGNDNLLRSLLNEFQQKYSHAVSTIRSQISDKNKQNLKAAETLIHTIKGMAGNLSAKKVRDSAKALEKAINKKQRDRFPGLLDEFEINLNQMLQSIAELNNLEEISKPDGEILKNRGIIDYEVIIPLLKQLELYLQKKDFKAMDCLDTLKPQLYGSSAEDETLKLAEHLDAFDFKGSKLSFAKLVKSLNITLEK
ncbi:MAG: response regulator [Magnetococcales bacterium]|nr:response regulator [Magnetococcales bacterium]